MIPKILQGPQSISEMQGTDAYFNCSASGIPPPTILWTFTNNNNEVTPIISTRNNKASENVTGAELYLLDVTEDNFGTYSCIALNIFDTVAEVATLVVKSSKFTIIFVMIALAYIYIVFHFCKIVTQQKPHPSMYFSLCFSMNTKIPQSLFSIKQGYIQGGFQIW